MANALPRVARLNRLLAAAWRSGLLPRPRLEPQALEAAALKGGDPSLFGPSDRWREPFEHLLASLNDEAALNPLGRAMAHGQIVMMLRARIRAARLWQAQPEILDRPLAPPIVILGQMRSGTTRLQRLLACDPRFGFTRMHESLIPVPFDPPGARRDRRRRRAALGLAFLDRLNPALAAIHPTDPDAPEEEFGLFSFSFGSAMFEGQWRVPAFSAWWEDTDTSWLYEEFRRLLLTMAWHRQAPADRPWVLKAPAFLQDLPSLHAAFPGARFVRLERDPAEIVASSASLVWNQARVQSDAADPAWIGREWLRKTVLREARTAAFFAAEPGAPHLVLGFEEVNRDWRGAMTRLYAFLGLDFTDAVADRMAAYASGERRHHGHRYTLEQFSLAPEEVRAQVTGARARAKGSRP